MRAKVLLFIACLTGIVLASIDLFDVNPPLSLQSNSVARVNDVDISREQFLNIIQNLGDARGRKISDKEAAFVLQELIDEELMVQRGYELGLLQLNSVLRNNMKIAMIESIIAENSQAEPDEKTLMVFYENNKDYFTGSTRIRITHMSFKNETTAKQVLHALENSEDYEQIKEQEAEQSIIDVPNTLLSLKELRKYLGPGLSEKIFAQHLENKILMIPHQERWHIIHILETQAGSTPNFVDIKPLVLNEYRRQKNENAIKDYLEWLRKRADIQAVNDNALQTLNQESN